MFSFCKMQATGNDFIIVDYTKSKFEYSFKLLAKYLCDRHYGVGADGLIILDKSKVADLKMRIFNPDGEEAEMCGNGIRCFAKYVYEYGIIQKESFCIETLAGIKDIELTVEGKTVIKIKIAMGEPIFEYDKIPVIYSDINYEKTKENIEKLSINSIKIEGNEFYPISIGNPHVVCFVNNVEEINIEEIGKKVENYKYFPNKTNVEFVEIIDENKIKVRIWERGVGETLSCGTGSCAATVISHIIKSTNCDLTVDLKGGNLKIQYDKDKKMIYLEGDAMEIFVGNIKI